LAALVIPHPAGMQQPALPLRGRGKMLTLVAAVLLMMLVGTMAAVVISHYYVEDAAIPLKRRTVFPDPGPPRMGEIPPNVR
jgi:hypothetical protein